jgi:DNA-binding transcriptional ArsR family regulator
MNAALAAEGMIETSEVTGLVDEDRPLSVEFGEYASATALLMEELGGVPFGAPQVWRKAVVSMLSARDIDALAPFVGSRPNEFPSSLCILPHRTRSGFASLEEDLERIVAIPPDALASELPTTPAWDAARRKPARWLDAFARAVRHACGGLSEQWRGAVGLLEREAERVGVAAVRGATRELLATRLPAALLRLEGSVPAGAEPGPRLGMVPMLGGTGVTHAWILEGKLTHIAYPMVEAWRQVDSGAPAPAELDGLLGPQRAMILRRLDRPATAGSLAEAMIAVPSAASHHIAVLERAGLVTRERRGRSVLVRRTTRGTELLALYSDG